MMWQLFLLNDNFYCKYAVSSKPLQVHGMPHIARAVNCSLQDLIETPCDEHSRIQNVHLLAMSVMDFTGNVERYNH